MQGSLQHLLAKDRKMKVSVVLNYYKRPHALKAQLEAIKKQTIKPCEILIWQNKGDLADFTPLDKDTQESCMTSISNVNWGVWSRFSYALNCRGDFICLFDDDAIPGERWIENCINTHSKKRGVLGTIGIIFNDLNYSSYERHGWASPNNSVQQVDIVGHSWFVDRELLSAFWREFEVPFHNLSGEDVHLSYSVQKYLQLNTYVPPHPEEDKSLWGSDPEKAFKLGVDNVAISVNYHGSHFGNNLKLYKQKGFKYLNL